MYIVCNNYSTIIILYTTTLLPVLSIRALSVLAVHRNLCSICGCVPSRACVSVIIM